MFNFVSNTFNYVCNLFKTSSVPVSNSCSTTNKTDYFFKETVKIMLIPKVLKILLGGNSKNSQICEFLELIIKKKIKNFIPLDADFILASHINMKGVGSDKESIKKRKEQLISFGEIQENFNKKLHYLTDQKISKEQFISELSCWVLELFESGSEEKVIFSKLIASLKKN